MMGQISYRQAKKPFKSRLFPVDLDAPCRDRTCDPRIKSPLLCQLSEGGNRKSCIGAGPSRFVLNPRN